MKNLIASAIVASGIATSGIAGAVETPNYVAAPMEPASVTDWSGFYVGGMASFDSGDHTYNDMATVFSFDETTSLGVFAGYNIQRGSLVYGAEVAYSTAESRLEIFSSEGFEYFADLKARVGYAFGDALVYGVVGGSFATYTLDWDQAGFNYGVGLDYMVTDSLFVGAEYLVRDLVGDTFNAGQEAQSNIQSAQIRAGWKF